MDQQFCQSATAVVVNKNSSSVHSSSSPSHSSSSAQEANHDSELTLDRQCSTLNYQIMKASELASSGNVSVFYKQRSPGGLQPEFVPILPNKPATTTSNSSVEDQTSHQKVAQQMVVDSKPVATPQVTYTNRQAVSHAQNNQLISSPNSATGGKNHTDITEESSLQARLEQKKALTVTPVNKPVLPKPPVQTNQRPKLVRSPVQAKSPQSLNQKSIQPQQVKPSPTQPQVNILHQGKPIIIQQQQVKSPVQGKAQLVQQAKSISSPRPNVTPIQVVKTVPQLPKPQVTPIQGKKLVTVNLKSNQIQLKQQLPQQIAQQGKVIQNKPPQPVQNKPPQPVQNKPPQPVQNKPSSSPVKQVSVQQAKQLNQFRVQSSQAAKQSFIQVNSQLKTYQPPTSPQLPKSVQLTVANSPAVNVSQQPSSPAVSVSQQAARNNVQTAASTFNITSKRANSSPANSGSPAKRTSLLQDMTPLMPLAERCRKSYQSTKKKSKVLTDADIDKFKLPSQVAAQVVQQAKQLSQQSTQLIQQSNQQMNQSNQLNQQPNQQTKQVFQLKQAGANPLPPVSATVLPSGLSQAITLITNQNKIATVSASNCSDSPQTTSGEKPINIPFQTLPETNQTYRIIIMTNDNKYDFVIDQSGSQIAEALQKLAQPNAGVSEQFGRAITESILRQCANTQSVEDMDGNVSLAAGQPLQLTEKEDESGEASSQESAPSPSKSDCENYEDKMALCHHCGYCSPTHDYCARCKTKLPPDVKSICLKPKTELQSNVLVKRTNEVAVALADSPKKRQRACKKKKVEEPVCLTISSDDEDANDSKCNNFKVAGTSGAGAGAADDPSAAINQDPAITQSVMLKEPVITDEEGAEEGAVKDGDYQDALEDGEIDAMSGECDLNSSETDSEWPVALDCRTVRIGSYKVVPNDRVYITLRGIYITIPSFVCENVRLSIPWESIVKILAHFGKGMPVIFIYTSSPMGAKIRKMLRMTDKNNIPYYDPASANESQRRITLLPENISVECSSLLKNLFSNLERTEYEELSQTEANDILVRASPKEVQNQVQKGVVNTTPRLPNEIQTIMVYPPPPAKGGIPINTEDYACLGEDQFLNDVIIDFYLKYLLQHYLSEKDQSRTHILSTFFYKRLTTKPTTSRRSLHNPVENDPKATAAEKRHSRVKSWTKHVDIFKKDFIIIPINEHSHWYLAVICFPGLTGPVDFDTMQPIDVNGANGAKVADGAKVGTTTAKKKSDTSGAGGDDMMGGKTSLVIGSTTITALGGADTVTVVQSEEEDRDEADGDDEDFDQASSEEEQDTDSSATKNEMDDNKEPEESAEEPVQESPEAVKVEEKLGRSRRKEPRKPIKQPCILIFDSLATASRAKVVATLRDYLKVEYKVKHGVERQFTKEYMKGASPKVPQQTNYTDCGLYVLQYVEAFFEAPITDYHIPIKTLQEWFDVDIVSRKRYDIQQLLHKLMGEQGIDFSTFNLPDLNLAPFHHGLVDYPDSEDELMAEEEDEEEEGEEEEEEYQEYGEAYRAMCEDARYNGYREEVEEEEEEDEEGEQHRMHVDEEMECDGDELEDEEEEEEEELEEDEEQDLEEDLERVMMGGEMDKDLLDEMVPNVCELKSYRIPRLNPRNDDIKINQSISIVRTGSIPDNKSDRNN